MKSLVLFLLAAATAPAWAAKTVAVTPADIDQVQELEEVVVRGERKLSAARKAIEEAEDRFYSRWNQINDDSAFDIHCRRDTPTGKRLSIRVCQPNFVMNIQAAAAQESLMAMQGGAMSPDSDAPALSTGTTAAAQQTTMAMLGGISQGGAVVLSDGGPQVMLQTQALKKRMLEMTNSDPELKRALLERARLDQYYQELRKEKFKR